MRKCLIHVSLVSVKNEDRCEEKSDVINFSF